MSQLNASSFLFSRTAGFYDHEIEQSLRFNNPDQPRLTRAVTHNTKTFTINFWVKRANLGRYWLYGVYSNSANTANLNFESDGTLVFYDYLSAYRFRLVTSRVFRDVGTWYCITLSVDTTQSTASDRVKIFVNGVQETSFSTETYPSQNLDLKFGGGGTHAIGTEGTNNRLWWDGYLADWNLIDGQALDPTSFGEFKSGIFIPKDTSGLTFGSGGYRLQFADSAAIGDDTSGNTNDWTVNNLVASDVVLDSPTNSFGVMSSIDKGDGTATYSEGNLKVSVGDNEEAFGSFGMSSGKWYWEIRYVSSAASNNKIGLGIADTANPNNNEVTNNGHQGTTYAPNDILAVAVDVDNELFSFYKNGTIIETDTDWSAKGWSSIKPIVTSSNSAGEEVCVLNFGQDDTFAGAISATGNTDGNGQGVFKYAPPSGYLALCSANLPTGAIDTLADETPSDYFNTVLYTGNGSTQSITSVGFQPSLTWIKARSTSRKHALTDSVRGTSARLVSNNTDAEETGITNGLTSFDADGFGLGDKFDYNQLSTNFVAWNWKANGSGVSNTDGSITSTVSVGATSQQNWFSVVSYTGNGTGGATVGHGLAVAPDMIIVKSRDNARDWRVYHSSLGATFTLDLNTTNAVQGPNAAYWNSTEPTSSVFSIGSVTTVNGNGEDYIAYCFANAEGLCKLGSYTGNGSTDGTFVYTGFRPAFVMWKRTDTTSDWFMMDVKRDIDNPTDHKLEANTNGTEVVNSAYYTDYLSNGFKLQNNNAQLNASGGNYIYLAIASQPFKYSNAR